MVAPKFTPTRDAGSEDSSPPCSFSFSPRKSLRKNAKMQKKAKTKKIASPVIWDEDDELTVLKGLVEYRATTGFGSRIDWDAFFGSIRGSIVAKVTKEQLFGKIRDLKSKFLADLQRINGGNDPHFTRLTDSQAFGYAMMIWADNNHTANGQDKAEQTDNAEEAFMEDQEDADAEPLVATNGSNGKSQHEHVLVEKVAVNMSATKEGHEDVIAEKVAVNNDEVANTEPLVATNDSDGNAQHEKQTVDGITKELCDVQEMFSTTKAVAYAEPLKENIAAKTPEKLQAARSETHEADIGTAEDLCAVQDAFESLLSQGLTDYQKKLQLQNLMNLRDRKRQELSQEWKELCLDAAKLNIKKLKFSAKLAEAASN